MIGASTTMRVGATLGLCLVLLGAAGCKRHPADHMNPFPASNEVAGWTRTGDVRTFSAADLWKYIDGEAERYVKADVQAASTADYSFGNKLEAAADVYTMRAVSGAQAIFDSEPAVGSENAPLGDAAHLFAQTLVFRRGRYLVRITAYEEPTETRAALLALGHGIEQRLTR
jgi:Family of unknown function (DUF6599)